MVDTIILNARIRPMSQSAGVGYAVETAVAISDGRIVSVGRDKEVLALAQSTTHIIDAVGAVLTPGLIDSHMHPVWGTELTVGLDLGGLTTLNQVREALGAFSVNLPPGAWIRGWNLDYKAFDATGIRGDLFEEAAAGRPLALVFYDLHTGLANAAAMEAANINGSETFSDASEIVVGPDGKPTGELREIPAYMRLLDAAPDQENGNLAERVRRTLLRSAASGVTSAAVMDGRPATFQTLDAVEQLPGGLPVRLHLGLWHQPGDDDAAVEERLRLRGRCGRGYPGGPRYQVSMIKMFIDGVIDNGTAWLHEPDTEGDSSSPFWHSVGRYEEVCRAYHHAGYQLATHSCGDAGVAQAVSVYRSLDGPTGPAHSLKGTPHRVEHLETLTDEDVAALADTGVVASMQPLHMQWREGDNSDSFAARLGSERVAHAYRVKDILDAGGRVVLGSDWPVAQQDARVGMAWARLRREPGNPEAPVFEPRQRLSGQETLLAYTRWAAEALGHGDLGVIAPGAIADLTLWEEDPLTADADQLVNLPVRLTMLGGAPVYHS
ncbi:amidohydrolase [Nesterenkonia natronophila]|uniref:Amidohydrolase n=1 Tax=Nesterenkonia natronophila TaxID=2174932 RepID=A0A3A4F3R4_9MICC|nr:amidohydrolase [Nesterenkonia natronophila]RJN32391.1 amidohydrolase [Nesterenkonia natronophila]